MTFSLHDKVILITGACGRIGKASVRLFLENGATVVASDLIPAASQPLFGELTERFGERRLLTVQSDACDESQVMALMNEINDRFGRLDGCFHNAFAQLHRPFADYTLEEWERVVRGTLTSAFLVSKHAVKMMLASGGGAILNTSSILSERPQAHSAAYSASKAAINQMTKVLALEYGASNIRANCLLPGDIKEPDPNVSAAYVERMKEITLIGRSGTPEEVAELAAFLLSDSAAYVTGASYVIDGGFRL